MEKITNEHMGELISAMKMLINEMKRVDTLTVRRHIDESFYLQKIEELSLLNHQLAEAIQNLSSVQHRISLHLAGICPTWQKDSNFLSLGKQTVVLCAKSE